MRKAVVFDLGGTLMEYRGMPLNWDEYYYKAFQNVSEKNHIDLEEEEIIKACDILKAYNPRNCKREEEIAPEIIFEDATAHWSRRPATETIINDFFVGMKLVACVFDYARDVLEKCKASGLSVACLTDLPNGMPDRIFRPAIKELEPLFDLYASSQTCGYRKPNKKGLEYVAECFGIDASEILFVGDEKKDEDTAANAGCEFKYIADFLKEWT